MGVSRPTLREVLRGLQEDGYLQRLRGAGTFVTHRPRLRNNLDVNFGVTDLIESTGMTPGTQDLRVYPAKATAEEAARLSIPPGAPVHVVERVRTADSRPVVFSRDVIPASVVGDKVSRLERMGQESLYQVYFAEFGVAVIKVWHSSVRSRLTVSSRRVLACRGTRHCCTSCKSTTRQRAGPCCVA